MIFVIDSLNKHEYPALLNDMFRLRKRVFADRLGWDVRVSNGMEKDKFDDLDPAHVISVDDSGEVVGCHCCRAPGVPWLFKTGRLFDTATANGRVP